MSTDDLQRTRFRRPLGLLIMGYKAALGLSEILVGTLLAFPGFDPQAIFARLSAEELREDPAIALSLWSPGTCPRCCTIMGRSRSG